MRDDRERRRIEKHIHEALHGRAQKGAAIPPYCADSDALAEAMHDAAARLGVRQIVEQKGPSNGESYHTSLFLEGHSRFPGSGSSDTEARAQALAILLGVMRVRPIPHLPMAMELAEQRGLTLEPCRCRNGVLLKRPNANSPTGNSPIVPCPHCNGRGKVWWSPGSRLVQGFSDEDMIQRVAPAEWKRLVEGGELDADGFAP